MSSSVRELHGARRDTSSAAGNRKRLVNGSEKLVDHAAGDNAGGGATYLQAYSMLDMKVTGLVLRGVSIT